MLFSPQHPQSITHCFTDAFPLWCDTGACGYSTKEWVSCVSFNKPAFLMVKTKITDVI